MLTLEIQVETYNCKDHKTSALTIKPIEEQDYLESRRAWSKVAAAIGKGNYDETSVHKSKIENAQRQLRIKEKDEGTTWQRRYFATVPHDETFSKLCQMSGENPDKSGGIWLFDQKRYVQVASGALDAQLKAQSNLVETMVANAPVQMTQ